MTAHAWDLVAAEQTRDGGDVLELSWHCPVCGTEWVTISEAKMPNEEAGPCAEEADAVFDDDAKGGKVDR